MRGRTVEVARIGCAQGRAFATEVVVGYLAYRVGGWPALGIYAVLAVVVGAAFTWLGWRNLKRTVALSRLDADGNGTTTEELENTRRLVASAEDTRRLERLIERANRESARRYPLPRRSP